MWPATEAVRVRNAFLLDPSQPGDFDWSGRHFPADFRVERQSTGSVLRARRASGLSATGRAATGIARVALAAHLAEHAQDKGAVQSDLRRMLWGDSRRVRVLRGLRQGIHRACACGDIPVRQWSFSFDGFGGHGHTVVEVWDDKRDKWLLLDVHNNVHLLDQATGDPLSALEFRDFLLARRDAPDRFVPNGPGREGFATTTNISTIAVAAPTNGTCGGVTRSIRILRIRPSSWPGMSPKVLRT